MSSSSYRAMAEKAKARAEDKFRSNDVRGARVQALKAQSLFPALPGLAQALTAYNVHLAAATRKLPSGGTDWHAVLDVPPTAGTDAIKKKFKRLCLLTHPDKNPSAAADGAFKLVVRAWDAISSSSSSSAASAAASCESQSSGFESRRRSTRSDSGSGFADGARKPSTGGSSSSSNSNANSGSGPQPGRSAASQESFDGSCGATHVVPYCLHCGANSGLRFTFERSGFLDVRIICPSCKKMYRCHMGIRLSS
uniref:J domain-containing protein n=1 Tax=Ananas comosus var. bracteatus TaxID=296719 RepID=A0A6V7PEJ6_ANACO|nr:unnamed protein product [Ananas comosus var. bracteatus]CAD1829298.1 unnamed protein product [Ananas comosus var. bracteatus]